MYTPARPRNRFVCPYGLWTEDFGLGLEAVDSGLRTLNSQLSTLNCSPTLN